MPQSIKNKTKEGVEVEIIISDNAINAGFKIGSPTDLEMILTDKNNDQYKADVFLKLGWTNSDLQEIITATIINCDTNVKSIKATVKGVISAN
ncbi:hypothetical protein [uncultured Chryseobacterium sp.]|uniref:hypothetical protein n=1 Tax=uncultured Chryseobacterium sp. TaxID=259322 RepID=UPI002588590B|nr:hypothetical protein [uncultured Chryseobacterium sp.]